MSEFGGLIRDAREKLGLSPHRVAELIGRGTGIVKAWERGRAVPSDPFVITSLAAVLALDETRLFHAAGMEVPDRQPHLTIEQELATIAPPKTTAPAVDPRRPADEGRSGEARAGEARVITDDHPEARTSAVTAPVPTATPVAPVHRPQPSPPRQERPPRRAPERLGAVEVPASGSYMDDPDERWSYRLRTLWTAAGMAALGVLLLWAGSRALDALGEAWDLLLAGL